MVSSRPVPVCLNTAASDTEQDRYLTEAEFAPVWEYFEGEAVKLARYEVGSVSLHRAEAIASGAGGTQRHLLAGVGAVRDVLRGNLYIIPDIVQEVGLAMWRAIHGDSTGSIRGLRASVHAVRAWLHTTVHYIVKQRVSKPAMLIFASGDSDDCESDDGACPRCERSYEPNIIQIIDTGRKLAHVEQCLSSKQAAVVRGIVGGFSYVEIAKQLGISESYARGLFRRARRKLIKLFGSRDGPCDDCNGGAAVGSLTRESKTIRICIAADLLKHVRNCAGSSRSGIPKASKDRWHVAQQSQITTIAHL